tara:strand:- start:1689 stop:1967 length:279 start_codon:yes stop_codon:yes gene_type:complete
MSLLNKINNLFDNFNEKIISNILLIIFFTIIYKLSNNFIPNSFNINMGIDNAFYFACVNNYTLGFGDILPTHVITKIFVCIHAFLFWFIMTA